MVSNNTLSFQDRTCTMIAPPLLDSLLHRDLLCTGLGLVTSTVLLSHALREVVVDVEQYRHEPSGNSTRYGCWHAARATVNPPSGIRLPWQASG
jgi:hypothetical protein